jgi:DNA-binding NtrC family response regulator
MPLTPSAAGGAQTPAPLPVSDGRFSRRQRPRCAGEDGETVRAEAARARSEGGAFPQPRAPDPLRRQRLTEAEREAGATEKEERHSVKQQLDSLISEMVEKGILFTEARREFEKRFIARVLQRHRGNVTKAAKDLQIHRNTLGKKIEEYKLL